MFYPDLLGAIIGGGSVVILALLYIYADELSDGNIGE